MHFRKFFHDESESVGRMSDLSTYFHMTISKYGIFCTLRLGYLKILDKFFGQIRIQRKKLHRKKSSDNISMKNEIFVNFYLFFESRRKTST